MSQENYEHSKGETRDYKYVLVGISKKVYKDVVKEMNIIALKNESSQQQCALQVCNQ